jgi:hypothetical protein
MQYGPSKPYAQYESADTITMPASDYKEYSNKIMALEQQNAELLAALEALVSYANDGLMVFPDNEEWAGARAAIAKAKGE